MANPLARIPGLAGILASREQRAQAEAQGLQQAQQQMNLQQMLEQRARQQQFQEVMAESNGDVETAMKTMLKSGDVQGAARLAPIVKMNQERKVAEDTRRGLSSILQLNQPQPQTQNQIAPGGGSGAPAQDRIARLNQIALLYPNNPTLQARIQSEITRTEQQAAKAPQIRERLSGNVKIQEEFRDGKWSEIGRGPRFEPKERTYPIVQTADGIYERRPEGLVKLNDPKTGQPIAPKSTSAEGLSPENAGKVAMSQQAVEGIGTTRGIVFDKDGKLNRSLVGAMNLPIVAGLPGNSQARIARSAIRNAVEAKLRIETGAAATESEVERTLARFLPTIADTDESAKFKLDELDKFFKSSLSMTKGVPGAKPGRLKFDAQGNEIK